MLREQREDDAEALAAPFANDPGFGGLIGFEEDPDATLPDNEPMIRCAERVGFRKEGVLRSYTFERGRPVDNLMCSLLPGELT